MSETLTLTGGATGQTYGTLAAATTYITAGLGEAYTAWLALAADDKKRALIGATRYLDRQRWVATADTFAERDAIAAFPLACYELAALAGADPTVLTRADQGSNIASVGAGGASVTYFNPTSARFGSASKLPQAAQDLVGAYLATATGGTAIGGLSNAGGSVNPFADINDYDRTEPY